MSTLNTHSLSPQGGKKQDKVSQKLVFLQYLIKNIATCSMVAEATGIPQKNCTRYKRELEEEGKLIEFFRKHCKITGFRASNLTANKDIIKSKNHG